MKGIILYLLITCALEPSQDHVDMKILNFEYKRSWNVNWYEKKFRKYDSKVTISLLDFYQPWGYERRLSLLHEGGSGGPPPRKFCVNMPSFGSYFAIQLSIFHQFCMFTLYGQIFLWSLLPDNPGCPWCTSIKPIHILV